MEWIKTEDQKPSNNEEVLTYDVAISTVLRTVYRKKPNKNFDVSNGSKEVQRSLRT